MLFRSTERREDVRTRMRLEGRRGLRRGLRGRRGDSRGADVLEKR